MNKITRATGYEKWESLLIEQGRSGLSQAAFCKQQNIVLSQFVYYRQQIQLKNKPAQTEANAFVPIQLTPRNPESSATIRVVLPNGNQYFIPCQLDKVEAQRWAEVLCLC